MKKKIIVTTSWDDGHVLDLKLAGILKKYNIAGTFYISPKNREFDKSDLLSEKEIVRLSKDFEIGAHTMTHINLEEVSPLRAEGEIKESKLYLESLLKREISSFSYPYGKYTALVPDIVKQVGFASGRTTKQMEIDILNKYEMGTTVEFSEQSILGIYGQYKDLIKNRNYRMLPRITLDWYKNSKQLFDFVYANGGIYHLWGHSWLIEKKEFTSMLEDLLSYISNKPDVIYLTNQELISTNKYEK